MNQSTSITFRPATPDDAGVLARLRLQFRSTLAPTVEDDAAFLVRCGTWMAASLAAGNPWRCWVATDGSSLVGAVWVCAIEKIPNPVGEPERHFYVSNLYVTPAKRGLGLGTELLSLCLRICDQEGADAVILWPTPRSRSLYLRHGFEDRDNLLERRLGHARS